MTAAVNGVKMKALDKAKILKAAIGGHGKTTLFDRFCAGDIDEHMDIFLDIHATKDAVIRVGIVIFQHIYHAPGTTLGAIRYNVLAEGGGRADQTRDSTSNRGCSCTAFSPCLSPNPGLDAAAEHVFGPQ
ncbi:hypothetical protein AAFF_G00286520 [Aldrovandia affinis]|uniref:Uncharacterized protein n=1 Tax=Aldrovandia affinis TaxID=143900 RepID=A0AAD7TAL3_9TELE|nr:hypothetical protein AAFF_G00286520 [Aldrovandia affinis]